MHESAYLPVAEQSDAMSRIIYLGKAKDPHKQHKGYELPHIEQTAQKKAFLK